MGKTYSFFDAINEDYLKTVEKYNLFRISFYTWYVMAEWGRLSPKLEKCLDQAENAGKQMSSVALRMQYPLAIIFNKKFLEKDVLESGKEDLENMFDKSTEAYDYFIRMIELTESENKK